MSLVNHVLIAIDFSACSQRALEYGAAMAATFGAKVTIAHVYSPLVIAVPEAVIPISAADLQHAIDRNEVGLATAAATAQQLGVQAVDTVLLEGQPWHEVVRLADDRQCDLVIVGTPGRGAVGHFFLGSVAEKIVRKANRPVLVVGGTQHA